MSVTIAVVGRSDVVAAYSSVAVVVDKRKSFFLSYYFPAPVPLPLLFLHSSFATKTAVSDFVSFVFSTRTLKAITFTI